MERLFRVSEIVLFRPYDLSLNFTTQHTNYTVFMFYIQLNICCKLNTIITFPYIYFLNQIRNPASLTCGIKKSNYVPNIT